MYAILFFLLKYLLVCVHAVGRCWKSLKIVSILKVLYFVHDNATVPSDFLAWLTSLHFSTWWFTFCRTIAMVVLSSSPIRVDTWNVSSFLVFNISTARSDSIPFELPPQLARQSCLLAPSADNFLLLQTLQCITLVPTAITLPVSFPIRLPWPAMQIVISWAVKNW